MDLNVEDVMVDEVITIDADATVYKAVRLMNKHEIGCVVVILKGKPVGIITERDMLKRVLAKSVDPEKIKVSDIMSAPLIIGKPKMEIENAVKLMFKTKIKKLPVVHGGRLIGLVTLTDITRFQPHMIRILKKLSVTELPPKRLKKVVDYYLI
ncbi:MAG: CBS domain-containing protein [Candidatus Bathyarchaeota archaeon]|nr:CBS domain-containing protein [Candidatus Bathyarchaeota archaeon]MDH5663122.1 CBS domain-containing protein [Candidatus Bathyarchaeota archaeon]